VLKKHGFVELQKQKQTSFRKQKALRIKAKKATKKEIKLKTLFLNKFRWKIIEEYRDLDTLFLEAIENNCINPLNKMLKDDLSYFKDSNKIISLGAAFTLVNPEIAKMFFSFFSSYEEILDISVLDYLISIDFSSLLMTNWLKWKKETRLFLDFFKYVQYWTKKIAKCLQRENKIEEELEYLVSLEKIYTKYFSSEALSSYSLKQLNKGIKEFSKENYEESLKLLTVSKNCNPENPITHWNLARISIILKKRLKYTGEWSLSTVNWAEPIRWMSWSISRRLNRTGRQRPVAAR